MASCALVSFGFAGADRAAVGARMARAPTNTHRLICRILPVSSSGPGSLCEVPSIATSAEGSFVQQQIVEAHRPLRRAEIYFIDSRLQDLGDLDGQNVFAPA